METGLTGARVERPHREQRVAMRPSRFLWVSLLAFIGIAGAAVFRTVGGVHGVVAALVAIATLGLAARVWARRQPVAISHFADTLTTWNRAGQERAWRIVGCAQWSGWLLALSLSDGRSRPQTLLIPADAIDPDTFRQLAVSARRAASAYL